MDNAELLTAARHDPVTWERVHASLVNYTFDPLAAKCRECGALLNIVPRLGLPERDGFITRDRVLVGADPRLGSVHLCRSCCFDPAKARARDRRRKDTATAMNYIVD